MKDYQSNIWKIYLYYFFASVEFVIAIYVLFLLDNGLSMTEVMILESVFTIMIFFFEVPSGAFADRVGRKWALSLSGILITISWLFFSFGTTFNIFLIAQILFGIGVASSTGADSALIYDSLKEMKREKEYDKIFGKAYFISMTTLGLMGLLSGYLTLYLDYRTLFYMTALFPLMGTIVNLTLKEPPIHKHLQEKNYFNHMKKVLKFSFNNKVIRNLIIYFGTFAAIGQIVYYIVQPYFRDAGHNEIILGFSMFFYFCSAALGSLVAWYFIRRIKEKRLLFSLLFIASVSLLVLSSINKYMALIFIGMITFTEGIRNIFIDVEINKHTSSHHRATVISVKSMSKNIVYTFVAPIFGLLVDVYTPEAAFFMMGITMMIFLVYIIWVFGWNSKGEIKA